MPAQQSIPLAVNKGTTQGVFLSGALFLHMHAVQCCKIANLCKEVAIAFPASKVAEVHYTFKLLNY